jgi:hypothetical protein
VRQLIECGVPLLNLEKDVEGSHRSRQ